MTPEQYRIANMMIMDDYKGKPIAIIIVVIFGFLALIATGAFLFMNIINFIIS